MGFYLYDSDVKKWKQVIEEGILKLTDIKTECEISDNSGTVIANIRIAGESKATWPIASFSLTQMPGCCGVMVSFHSQVSEQHRNLGIGSFLHDIKIAIAKDNKYSSMLCTDIEGNLPQEAILTKNGWKKAATFNNVRTGNNVAVHFKNLR